jgi:phosphoglycolate phosphatase-like HAD superfamily hydrolase
MNTLILDLDGTLLDSLTFHFQAALHVFEVAQVAPPSKYEWRQSLRPPFEGFYTDRGVKLSPDKIWKEYNTFFDSEILHAPAFADTLRFLSMARYRSFKIIILSSGKESRVVRHCQLTGISQFAHEIYGGVIWKREIFSRLHSRRGRIISISDFAHDTEEAHRFGFKSVGLTRGISTWLAHKKAGADIIRFSLPLSL